MKSKKVWIPVVMAGVVLSLMMAHEATSQRPGEPRVAVVVDIMKGIQQPNMQRLNRAIRGAGPADDEAWAATALQAAMLNEASHILVQNNRSADATWAKACADLRAASAAVHAAAKDKDLEALRAAAPAIGASCKSCHDVHRK